MAMTLTGNGAATGLLLAQANMTSGISPAVPAFVAYATAAQGTAINDNKLNLPAKEFDTANCFDTTTSRYTPNVAGYYLFNGGCSLALTTANDTLAISVNKNGATAARWGMTVAFPANRANVTALLYMNGTTDYVELHAWRGGAGTTINTGYGVDTVYFQGVLVRAA